MIGEKKYFDDVSIGNTCVVVEDVSEQTQAILMR